jgi:hypothetical protein
MTEHGSQLREPMGSARWAEWAVVGGFTIREVYARTIIRLQCVGKAAKSWVGVGDCGRYARMLTTIECVRPIAEIMVRLEPDLVRLPDWIGGSEILSQTKAAVRVRKVQQCTIEPITLRVLDVLSELHVECDELS